jgi:hypothetical protein
MQRMTAGRELAVRQGVQALRLRAIVAELNEFGMEASEPAKPGQQVIIYRLRPLLQAVASTEIAASFWR